MAKKKKNKKLPVKDDFYAEIDKRIKSILQGMLSSVDQRISVLNNNLETVKANIITTNTILNSKGIITRDEFMHEFNIYSAEVGVVDGSGNMEGSPILSLYNLGE